MKLSFKIIGLLAFVYFTNHGFSSRVETLLMERPTYLELSVFLVLWLIGIVSLIIAGLQQKWTVRLLWALIIPAITAAGYAFYVAGGSELQTLDVLVLWQARHEAGRAFEFYQQAAIQGAIVAVIGFLVIIFPPPVIKGKFEKALSLFAWVPIIPISLFFVLILIKSDDAVAGLPQQFAPLSIASVVGYKLITQDIPERNKVSNKPANQAVIKNILYLVDESINPRFVFDKKDFLLKGLRDNREKIANFGVAVSGGNCSARSNAILRLGGTRDNILVSLRKSPTIWQFAKKAGFRTVFIDAQTSGIAVSKPNNYQNFMTRDEAMFIDKLYKIKDVDTPMLDFRLIELIQKELKSDIPTFIYANKNGAHFPYYQDYPASETVYKPAATQGESGLRGLTTSYKKSGLQGVINSYKNAVRWTVDIFFQKFFQEIDLSNTLVIYTSDHGQRFAVNATTHCSSGEEAPIEESLVPMMVITDNQPLKHELKKVVGINYNKTDHFDIFPTILKLFGYSKDRIKQYGPNLLEKQNSAMTAFNTGDIMGITSSDEIWVNVPDGERTKYLSNDSN